MEKLYIEVYDYGSFITAPIESVVVLFVLKFVRSKIAIEVIIVPNKSPGFKIPLSVFDNVKISVIGANELPSQVKNCLLPVICVQEKLYYVCGMCAILRRILKQTDCCTEISQKLLGFRGGCLTACAEVSTWTRFCELEVINITKTLTSRGSVPSELFTVPMDLLRFESHLRQPVRVHNIFKRRQDLVKKKNSKFQNSYPEAANNFPVGNSEGNAAEQNPHVENDKDTAAWLNVKPKFVCFELSKTKNQTVEELVANMSIESDIQSGSENDLDNKQKLQKQLNRDSLPHLQHKYAEGTDMTLPDIILFPCIHQILVHAENHFHQLYSQVPLILKWYKRMVSDVIVRQTMLEFNFNLDLAQKINKLRMNVEDVKVLHNGTQCSNNRTMVMQNRSTEEGIATGPRLKSSDDCCSADSVIETNRLSTSNIIPEIRNCKASGFKAKLLTRQDEIIKVLHKIQEASVEVEYVHHPCVNVSLDWTALPVVVHPSYGELPTSRVARKCQQLENLVSVILKIAKQGDVIVDFCSGGGHLGIVVAYLLPRCQIIMIDNKEESSTRAQQRVQALGLNNVILYQSNLDYFAGHFNIGTSLHACGVASDLVLQRCLEQGASFVICPCCYGAIQNNHNLTYPRSDRFKQIGINYKEYLVLGHSADQTHINDPKTKQGIQCMGLIDTDRIFQAKIYNYTTLLCTLIPRSCTPKHNLLIGIPPTDELANID